MKELLINENLFLFFQKKKNSHILRELWLYTNEKECQGVEDLAWTNPNPSSFGLSLNSQAQAQL